MAWLPIILSCVHMRMRQLRRPHGLGALAMALILCALRYPAEGRAVNTAPSKFAQLASAVDTCACGAHVSTCEYLRAPSGPASVVRLS